MTTAIRANREVNVRVRRVLPVLAAFLSIAAPAQAAVPHTVQPGETLWSIAAANNLTTRTVAAFNGLSENSQVVLGATVMVPTTVEGYASLQQAGLVPASPATTTPSSAAAAPAPPPAAERARRAAPHRRPGRNQRTRRGERPRGTRRVHRARRRHAVGPR